jgi:periplasmic protein TonB
MAPLKEADTLVGTSAPADNAAKNPAETATRTQPVALEIPVTINGAHTVAGSDKREPFSETTQTVLVFSVGAVVRVSTSLAPGQLVFLTNEKTKKEVVCQVLKSKSGGSGGGYVELQFTEPAPGFWGLRMAGGPAAVPTTAAPAPKPVATAPASPKPAAVPPPPAATLSESVLAKPKAPTAAPVLPSSAPKTAAAPPSPTLRISPPPAPAPPAAPLVSVPPPSPLGGVKEQAPPVQAAPPLPPPPAAEPTTPTSSTSPDSSSAASDTRPGTPVLHDYSKDIDALFTASPSHAPAPPTVAPADPSVPSTEQLKADAARLQAQLSSLLFSEAPAANSSTPAAPLPKPGSSNVLAQKILEIATEEPKSAVVSEPLIPIPAPPARKPAVPAFSVEEQEVKVPAWLAPLSQNSEPAREATPSLSVESADEISAPSGESSGDAVSPRSEAAVFGGQLLAGSSETNAASSGSKKGLWIGIAAAAVLAVTGAAWYLRADLFGASKSPANKPAPAIASSLPPAQPAAESKPSASSPEANLNSAPAPVTASSAPPHPQPVKSAEPTASAALATAAARELKTFTSEPKKPSPVASAPAPTPEPKEKSELGDVRLATPKVSRAASEQTADGLPSIDTQTTGSVNDALASSVRGTPSVPLPVGGEVQSAQLIKSVPPAYPPMAKSQHVSGNVQIDALVDASGNVAELKVISGPGMLHRAALDAVKQWKYKPAMLDGQPTSMHLTVTVQFRAQ